MNISWRVSVGLVVAFLARNALAQPSPVESAEAHVQRGLELRRSEDDAAALDEFLRAQALAPTPRIRAQVALALQALGRWREVEEFLLQVLSDDSDPWVRAHGDVLRESLSTAQHRLAWLSVDCNVAGAELQVNGTSVGKLPLPASIRVVAGAVVLQLRAEGYEPAHRTIDVPAGTRVVENVVLVTNWQGRRIDIPTTVTAPDPQKPRRTAGWITLAAGGALSAGGLAASLVSAAYVARYNDDSRCYIWPLTRDQRCRGDREIAQTTRIASIVALATGVAALGTGVFLLATSQGRRAGSAAHSLPCKVGLGSIVCEARF